MPASCCCGINLCIQVLILLTDFGAFICVAIIVSVSKSNPFKSHIIGDINTYYNPSEEYDNSFLENSIYNSIILNETSSLEEIYNGTLIDDNLNKDIIKTSAHLFNYNKLFKRKLESESFCTDIHDSFIRNNGKKLSYIFDLNYETIYELCIALLIVMLVRVVLSVVYYIYTCLDKSKGLLDKIILILIMLLWIAKFVLFILIFHFIENGDIEKYDDFLDCKNVRTNYFKNFNDVDKLRKCFIAFTVLNLLSDIFDKVEKLFKQGNQQVIVGNQIPPISVNNSTDAVKENN